MEERVFFEDSGVQVTNARFIVDGQTYAMNGVTSVKSHMTVPSRRGPIIAIAIGLLCLLAGTAESVALGALIGGAGILVWVNQKNQYSVVLSSASGEAQALTSSEEARIATVVSALNEALIHRG